MLKARQVSKQLACLWLMIEMSHDSSLTGCSTPSTAEIGGSGHETRFVHKDYVCSYNVKLE